MADFSLNDNPFTADPADKIAKIENAQSYGVSDLVQMIIDEGSTLNRADVEGSISSFFEKCAKVVSQGGNLNLPILNTSLSISGVFVNADDVFDPKRHSLKLNANAGSLLKNALKKVKLTKIAPKNNAPNIVSVTDKITGAVDGDIKAGSVVKLSGNRLKFEENDAEQGVFFVQDGVAKRQTTVLDNKPASVVVIVPSDLVAGEVKLELRSKLNANATAGKTLRTAVFAKNLTVTA